MAATAGTQLGEHRLIHHSAARNWRALLPMVPHIDAKSVPIYERVHHTRRCAPELTTAVLIGSVLLVSVRETTPMVRPRVIAGQWKGFGHEEGRLLEEIGMGVEGARPGRGRWQRCPAEQSGQPTLGEKPRIVVDLCQLSGQERLWRMDGGPTRTG